MTDQQKTIAELCYDPQTGQMYAIGFTADGTPYRAFVWVPQGSVRQRREDWEQGYELAQ